MHIWLNGFLPCSNPIVEGARSKVLKIYYILILIQSFYRIISISYVYHMYINVYHNHMCTYYVYTIPMYMSPILVWARSHVFSGSNRSRRLRCLRQRNGPKQKKITTHSLCDLHPCGFSKRWFFSHAFNILHHQSTPFLVGDLNPSQKYDHQNGFIFPFWSGFYKFQKHVKKTNHQTMEFCKILETDWYWGVPKMVVPNNYWFSY